MAHHSFNVNARQQYFLRVYVNNSNYNLKFILPAFAHLRIGEVVDGARVDENFSYNIIPKSSEKLLILVFKRKMIKNGNTYLNKICSLDFNSFSPKSLCELIQIQKSDDFNSFPLLNQHFFDDKMYNLLTYEGVFLNEYYTSISRPSEEKLLPIVNAPLKILNLLRSLG